MIDVNTIEFLVLLIGCAVGLAGWIRSLKRDSSVSTSAITEINTKLNFISDDLKDIKAEQRNTAARMTELEIRVSGASSKAEEALKSAESAHDRIDKMDAYKVGMTD